MPIVTYLLLAVNIILSLICFTNRTLYADLMYIPYEIKRRKQWYRIISGGFIHGSQIHLLFNMMSLYFIGSFIEPYINAILPFGNLSFFIFYMGALIASHLPVYFKHQNNASYAAVGASGAISAVILALVMANPWIQLSFFFIPMPGIVFAAIYLSASLYFIKSGTLSGIGHEAHLYGALYGIVVMALLGNNVWEHFIYQLLHKP